MIRKPTADLFSKTNSTHGDEVTNRDGLLHSTANENSSGYGDGARLESHEAKNSDGQQLGQTVADAGDGTQTGQENFGTDATNGGYHNAMFPGSGDYNQMQMMMAMQNGMGPNSFGNFSMMGTYFNFYPSIIVCVCVFLFFSFATTTIAADKYASRLPWTRYAGNGYGPNGDAKHVHERWLSRHGHERHGRQFWRWIWAGLQYE